MKKTLIISVYYNQKSFLEHQLRSLEKFFVGEFVFCFFDNSPGGMNLSMEKNLHGFEYFRVPQDIFTGGGDSKRAGQSLDYAIKTSFQKYPDLKEVLILDSDMFPIKKFTFEDLLGDNDFSGIVQHKGHVFYYNNQLVALRRDNISNWNNFSFDTASIEGEATDCGGRIFFFFRDDNSHLKRKDLRGIHSNQLNLENLSENKEIEEIDGDSNFLYSFFESDISLNGGSNFSEIYESKFLHFRAGSNWIKFGESAKINREQNLFNYLQNITKD